MDCAWPTVDFPEPMQNLVSTTKHKERCDEYITLFAEGYLGRGDINLEERRRMWELLDEEEFKTCPPCDEVPKLPAKEALRRLDNCEVKKERQPLSVFSPIMCEGDAPDIDLQDVKGDEDFTTRTVALPHVMRPMFRGEDELPRTARNAAEDPLETFLARIETEKERILEENPCLDPCELQRMMEQVEEEMWNSYKMADGVIVDIEARKRRLKSRGYLVEKMRWKRGDEADALFDPDCPEDMPHGGVIRATGEKPTKLGRGCTGMPSTRHITDIACQKLLRERYSDAREVDVAMKLVNSPSMILEDDHNIGSYAPCSDLGRSRPHRHAKQVQHFDQDNRTEGAFHFKPRIHPRRAHHYQVTGNPLFCRKNVECRRLPSIHDMKEQVRMSHEQGKLYRESCAEQETPGMLCQFFTKLFCPDNCGCEKPTSFPENIKFSHENPCPKVKSPPDPPEPTPMELLARTAGLSKNTYPFSAMKKVRPRRHTIKYSWNRKSTMVQDIQVHPF